MTPYLQNTVQRSRRRSPDKTREKKEKERDKKKEKNKNQSDFYSLPLTLSKRNKYSGSTLKYTYGRSFKHKIAATNIKMPLYIIVY